MKRIIFFIALFLALPMSANAKRYTGMPLQASSPWNLNYTPASCELRREFGDGEDQILLIIIQGPKFGVLELMLVTPKVSNIWVNTKADLSFVNVGESSEVYATVYPGTDTGKSIWRLFSVSPDILKNGTQDGVLNINVKKLSNVSLELGSLLEPANAFKICQLDLFKMFGMDYDLLSQSKRLPQPKGKVGSWIMASDYPQPSFKLGLEGTTEFRLDVDATGQVQKCTILVSSGHSQLDETACTKAKERGRFDPALNQNDEPTAAPWVNSVRWQVPR